MPELLAESVGHVRVLRLDRPARVTEEIRNALAGLDSEDGREAVRAIMEKRAPEFRGR